MESTCLEDDIKKFNNTRFVHYCVMVYQGFWHKLGSRFKNQINNNQMISHVLPIYMTSKNVVPSRI